MLLTLPSAGAMRAVALAAAAVTLATIASAWSSPLPVSGPAAGAGPVRGAVLADGGIPAPALSWSADAPPVPTAVSSSVPPATGIVPVLQSSAVSTAPIPPAPISGAISQLAADGIPATALDAYQRAAARADLLYPGCAIPWALLAGIGRVESDHGRFGGSQLYADGESAPPIIGIPLDGVGTARILDTDHGRLDGDPVFDRAVGPMQFIPGTWRGYGVDGNGDGRIDPFNIYDAAAAAADYLCTAGGNLSGVAGQTAAVLAYNQSDAYLSSVLALEAVYAGGGIAIPPVAGGTPPPSAIPSYSPPAEQPASGPLPPVNPGPPLSPPAGPPVRPTGAPSSTAATSAPNGTSVPVSTPVTSSAPTSPTPSSSTPTSVPSGSTTTPCPTPAVTVTVTVTVSPSGSDTATPSLSITVTAPDTATPSVQATVTVTVTALPSVIASPVTSAVIPIATTAGPTDSTVAPTPTPSGSAPTC